MRFTVITKRGKTLVFNIKACAEIFVQAYGGVMFGNEILTNLVENDLTNPVDVV